MPRVKLYIQQPRNEFTLKTLLEAHGYAVVTDIADILITDDYTYALKYANSLPTLVLATAQQIPQAVELMKQGVYGYIFIPFQPNEASMMIERALGLWNAGKNFPKNPSKSLIEMEKEIILKTLAECHYSRTKTAQKLGIGRNTLWRKLKKINFENKKQ